MQEVREISSVGHYKTVQYAAGFLLNDDLKDIQPLGVRMENLLSYINKDQEAKALVARSRKQGRNAIRFALLLPLSFISLGVVGGLVDDKVLSPIMYAPVIGMGVGGIVFGIGSYKKRNKYFINAIKTYNRNSGYGYEYHVHYYQESAPIKTETKNLFDNQTPNQKLNFDNSLTPKK